MPKAPSKASHCYSLRPRKPNTQGIAKPSKKAGEKLVSVEPQPAPETVDRNDTIPSTEECRGSVTREHNMPANTLFIYFYDNQAPCVEHATGYMRLHVDPKTGKLCVFVRNRDFSENEFNFSLFNFSFETHESHWLVSHIMQQLKTLDASVPSVCLCNVPVYGYPGCCEQYHFSLNIKDMNTMVVKVVRSGTDHSEYIAFTARCMVDVFLSTLESFSNELEKLHKGKQEEPKVGDETMDIDMSTANKLPVDQLYTTLLSLRDREYETEFVDLKGFSNDVIRSMFEQLYGERNAFLTKEKVQECSCWKRLSETSKESLLRFSEACNALLLAQRNKEAVALWKYYRAKIKTLCW